MPAALALVLWWKRRLTWRHAALLLPMLIFGVAMGRLTAWVEVHYVGARGPAFAFSFADRCLIAGRALWFYAGKLAWPHPLIFIYPRWNIDAHVWWQWLYPLAFLALLATLFCLRRRIGRSPLVAVLFFAGTLFPALGFANIFPMQFSFVADHFQYLASVGLLALFATGATRVLPAAKAWLPLTGLLAVLALLTWSQCFIYDDYETLYRDTLAKNPNAWMAHNNLGTLLEVAGRSGEALDEYARAAALAPWDIGSRVNLGKLLLDTGHPAKALAPLRAAVKLDPIDAGARLQLGRALQAVGDLTAAAAEYREAVRLRPTWDEPANHLRALPTPPTTQP
jgi:tetratricopeptide (TPR) repeat protein